MLAEEVARAARGHVSYEELMLTPDGGISSTIGGQVGWDGNSQQTLAKLKEKGDRRCRSAVQEDAAGR